MVQYNVPKLSPEMFGYNPNANLKSVVTGIGAFSNAYLQKKAEQDKYKMMLQQALNAHEYQRQRDAELYNRQKELSGVEFGQRQELQGTKYEQDINLENQRALNDFNNLQLKQESVPTTQDIWSSDTEGTFRIGQIPAKSKYIIPTITLDPMTGKPVSQTIGKQFVAPMTPEQTASKTTLVEASKNIQDYIASANKSVTALDKMAKYATNLGDFKTGLVSQALAKGKTTVQEFAKDPKVTEYLGVVSQELIPAARDLMEEKGPITEFDVARVEKGLGDITTPLETKFTLLNELKNKIKAVISIKLQAARIPLGDFRKKYPQLYSNVYEKVYNPKQFQQTEPILVEDANGNKAWQMPDGTYKEIK